MRFINCIFWGFLLVTSFDAIGQKIELINSQAVVDKGKILYDSGKYPEAIEQYLKVSEYDTNYVYMLTELAMAYNNDKQYGKAIEVCNKVLEKPSYQRSQALKTLAIAYDKSDAFEKSVSVFKDGIRDYPFDYLFRYNLGITYFNHKDYKLAEEYFIQSLRLNPFHGGSHYNLGRLAALEGKKVRAMMALGIYLSLNNKDNKQLVFLEQLMNNEFIDESSVSYSQVNAFEKLDQIVRAKIVMDKNFKPVVPLKATLVRQYQLLFDQLPVVPGGNQDFWIEFYLPIYRALKDKNLLEPFLYHILSSSNFDDVKKWNSKNGKRLDAFYIQGNESIAGIRRKQELPKEMGFENPVSFWFTRKHTLEAIGNQVGENTRIGKWMIFADNGQCIAEGSFDNGNKIGVWKYYHADGRIKEVENKSTGKIEVYNEDGNLIQRYFLKDKQVQGDVEFYYPCGVLKEKLTYGNGKRQGPGKSYYLSGDVEVAYSFMNDEKDGPYLVYYSNGKLLREMAYKAGKLEGEYKEYHVNGKLKLIGKYVGGELSGIWKYYHGNGRLQKEGAYKNGLPLGEWIYYDIRGNLIEKQIFDDKGRITGENQIYHEGKIHFVMTYKSDIVTGITNYDKSGKVLGKYGSNDGTFSVNGYFPTGELRYEGAYKKGKTNGQWKYYYRMGAVETILNYDSDRLSGKSINYYKSGTKKKEAYYKDGELDGYSSEYYQHGQLKEHGWFSDGWRQQHWISYYANGSIESDYYYLNGKRQGSFLEYNADSKLYFLTDYKHEEITAITYFNEKGERLIDKKFSGEKKEFIDQKFKNGKSRFHLEVTCGEYAGDIVRWLPSGQEYFVNPIKNGKRNGHYKHTYPTGVIEVDGYYIDGQEEGRWVWYEDNGKKSSEGDYVDGERDSVWLNYHYNGKISTEKNYKNDVRDGVSRVYSSEGILILEKLYNDKDIIAFRATDKAGKMGDWLKFTPATSILAYFPNGNKAYEELYKNGQLEGKQIEYYQDGSVYNIYEYSDGELNGKFFVNYPNGKTMKNGEYKFGYLEGVMEYYNESGSLKMVENYICGVRNGKVVLYNNGVKKGEINFWAGLITE